MPRTPISAFANGTLLSLTTAPQAVSPLLAPESQVEVTVVEHDLTAELTVYEDETTSAVLPQPVLSAVDGSVPGWLDEAALNASGADLILALPGGNQTVVLVSPGAFGGSATSPTQSSGIDGGTPSSNASNASGIIDGGTP